MHSRIALPCGFVASVLLLPLAGCGGSDSPVAPDHTTAALAVEQFTVQLTAPDADDGAFVVEAGVTLRETAGVGATLSVVTLTLTDTAGVPTSIELEAAEAFGANRIAPGGTLTAGRIAATPRLLFALAGVGVRVGFLADGARQAASAQASTELSIDVSGDWTGDLPLRVPAGQAQLGVLTLDQSGEAVSGSATSADGFRFRVTGGFSTSGFDIYIYNYPPHDPCLDVWLDVTAIGFRDGHTDRLRGRWNNECSGGTGTFELRRR